MKHLFILLLSAMVLEAAPITNTYPLVTLPTLTNTFLWMQTNTLASNGVVSLKSNKVDPSALSLASSPYTYTNPNTYNMIVFFNGANMTGISIGATAVYSGTFSQAMVIIQPGESFTLTFSGAVPTVRVKPL